MTKLGKENGGKAERRNGESNRRGMWELGEEE